MITDYALNFFLLLWIDLFATHLAINDLSRSSDTAYYIHVSHLTFYPFSVRSFHFLLVFFGWLSECMWNWFHIIISGHSITLLPRNIAFSCEIIVTNVCIIMNKWSLTNLTPLLCVNTQKNCCMWIKFQKQHIIFLHALAHLPHSHQSHFVCNARICLTINILSTKAHVSD